MNPLVLVNQSTYHLSETLRLTSKDSKESRLNLKLLVVSVVENLNVSTVNQVETAVLDLLENGVAV